MPASSTGAHSWLRPRGFTLIELLVVVAIIGLLVAIMLPAVQGARERGRRLNCANNLKQISLAVLQYHGSYGCFPPGNITLSEGLCTLDGSNFGYPSQSGTNWLISILPFVEQQHLKRASCQSELHIPIHAR